MMNYSKELRLDYNYKETEMKKEFEESYEMLCATNEPFWVKIKKIFEKKHITLIKFQASTQMEKHIFYRFTKEDYIPSMKSLMSFAMGFNLDFPTVESLLDSLAIKFERTDRTHCAYMFLLTHYQGLNIDDCNIILKALDIDSKYFLGGKIRE